MEVSNVAIATGVIEQRVRAASREMREEDGPADWTHIAEQMEAIAEMAAMAARSAWIVVHESDQ